MGLILLVRGTRFPFVCKMSDIAFPRLWSPFRVRDSFWSYTSPWSLPCEKQLLVEMCSDGNARPEAHSQNCPSFLLGNHCPQSGRTSLRHGVSHLDQKQTQMDWFRSQQHPLYHVCYFLVGDLRCPGGVGHHVRSIRNSPRRA